MAISFGAERLSRHLGAEITGLDLSAPLDPSTVEELRRSWHEHLVLVFRGQSLSDRQLLDFSLRIGPINGAAGDAPTHAPGFPQILVVSNVIENGRKIGVLGDGEALWHTDMSYLQAPPSASLLYALELPPAGGDTCFLNMYTAFDTLPEDLAGKVVNGWLFHDGTLNSAGKPRIRRNRVSAGDQPLGSRHPLVRRHPETGRPALFLGRRSNTEIVGLDAAASRALLDRLWEHCQASDAVYRHRWRIGDLVMWDNRCTMHRRDAFDPASRRVMHRTEIAGTQPIPA